MTTATRRRFTTAPAVRFDAMLQIRVPQGLADALHDRAQELERPAAALVREAVAEYLQHKPSQEEEEGDASGP